MAQMHKKPSKAELQEQVDKALKDIEETPVTMVTEEVPDQEPQPEEPPQETPPEEPQQEEQLPKTPPFHDTDTDEPDYRKKFVESSREAQVLHAKNKQISEAIEAASQLPDPTEEELQKEYSEWDMMTDTEKRLAKESLISTRRFTIISTESQKFKDVEAWNGKVDAFVQDPKTLTQHPELEGKIDEFTFFASKPTRRGVDFDILVSAFLHDATRVQPKKRGAMFEQGTGGDAKPPASNGKLSVDEGRRLMQTDFKKFKELLTAGKIET